jgi:hypothetical protein
MLPEAAAGGAMGYFMSDRWIRPQNHDGRVEVPFRIVAKKETSY